MIGTRIARPIAPRAARGCARGERARVASTHFARARLMALRVVGAGVGRTGTASLKLALERLLGGRCYHMLEVLANPADDVFWKAVVHEGREDFATVMDGFAAAVDWPAAAYWRELAAQNPDALILLSTRESAERWWTSYDATIVGVLKARMTSEDPASARHASWVIAMLQDRFTVRWDERTEAIAAYERHNEDVRAGADPERLLEWRPGDGWEPICEALGVAVPGEPFPHENTTADFQAAARERAAAARESAS
jgi:Sulfotransferase domain